jgi:hypothetical protein
VTAKALELIFASFIMGDAGSNLVLEFRPNITRKFPIMQKLRLE